jgi:hypothetical protein
MGVSSGGHGPSIKSKEPSQPPYIFVPAETTILSEFEEVPYKAVSPFTPDSFTLSFAPDSQATWMAAGA